TPAAMSEVAATPAVERNARISPDGAWISFIAARGAHTTLWVRNRRERDSRPIKTGDGMITSHAWAPDGQQIAYIVRSGSKHSVFIVPSFFGGVPREIASIDRPARAVRWVGGTLYIELPAVLAKIDLASGSVVPLSESWDLGLRATR